MATRGQDIVSLIKRQIEEFGGDLSLVDVGTVVQVGDGVASIQGLQGVRSNELLDFGNDVLGLALNLESDIVGSHFGRPQRCERRRPRTLHRQNH